MFRGWSYTEALRLGNLRLSNESVIGIQHVHVIKHTDRAKASRLDFSDEQVNEIHQMSKWLSSSVCTS